MIVIYYLKVNNFVPIWYKIQVELLLLEYN